MRASQRVSPSGYALLGLLSFGRELTGYELKQWAEDSLRFFYAAPAMSHVYRELARLQDAGLVRAREVRDGARTITVYRLSRQGSTVLRRWLAETPVEPPLMRHHLALRVFLGHLAEPGQLLAQVDQQRAWCEQTLADLERVRDGLADDPANRWCHARLVADWGLEHYAAELRSLELLAERLAVERRD